MEMIACARPKHEGHYYRRKHIGQPNRTTFRALPHYSDRFEKIRQANLIIGDGGILIGMEEEDQSAYQTIKAAEAAGRTILGKGRCARAR
jgi:hypothetical protein